MAYQDESTTEHMVRTMLGITEFEAKGHKVKIIQGERISTFQFPYKGWYRHDTIEVDGVKLDGSIQVRRRPASKKFTVVDTLTCFRGGCVRGSDWYWLYQQNQIGKSNPAHLASSAA